MMFKVGDFAEKNAGDYYFRGVVVSVFRKLSGVERCVVENADGVLLIFSERQLNHVPDHSPSDKGGKG